jgi:hypothetical protein
MCGRFIYKLTAEIVKLSLTVDLPARWLARVVVLKRVSKPDDKPIL